VSSLITGNFAEKNEERFHGMIVLNNDATWKFFPNPHTPKYRVMDFDKDNVKTMMNESGCFIKFLLKQTYEFDKLEKIKQKLLQTHYDVFFVNDMEVENSFAKIEDWTSIITQSPEDILKQFVHHTAGEIGAKEALVYLENLT
jgi:hypothetical protein